MEYVEPAVSIATCLGTPVCKYLQYHRKLNDYVTNLKRIRDELNSKVEYIELQLKAELLPVGKIPKPGVQNWLDKAKAMIGEAQGVESKVSNGRFHCRARNGKLVDEKTQEMQAFLDKAPNDSASLVVDDQSVGLPLRTSELVGEKAVRDEIWQCLMQEEVSMIGVWGLGGVGKTTIMMHIHDDLLKQCRFDKVIWVTVSKDFDVIKLQDDIASALNLKDYLGGGRDKVRRAAVLSEMLKRTGKHVLILDDLWEEISLEEVGIPEPSNNNGCKLVLTTRSVPVCKRMGCKDIPVKPLSEEEALLLFLNKVGPKVVHNTTIMPTLKLVVNECAGLPLTIVVVAATLKGEDDALIWKDALNKLKRQIGMFEEVEVKVIECLKFSFDRLKEEKMRQCFLYCSLYPEDFEIIKDVLIECWIDERFIDEMDTRQDMKDKGHVILKKLIDNCLLENTIDQFGRSGVKMHDAMRDMALSITSTNPRYMIQAGMQLKKLPKEEEWRADIEKVSLMKNYISEISEDNLPPSCQLLTTLLLQENRIEKIPNAFFANMPHLTVLNLSYTQIKSLPNSVSELKNLIALLLRRCERLKHLPCFLKLQRLKKLDLYGTDIKEVPQGMDMLVDLRYLDLDSTKLIDIPAGLISKLCRLQHLEIDLRKTKACLEEIMTLENLEWFEGCLEDIHELNKFVSMRQSMKNLTRYRLQVVSRFAISYSDSADKSVIINRYKSCEGELTMLPFDVQFLEIFRWNHLKSLNDDLPSLENANCLTKFRISECKEIEYVVSFSSPRHLFQSLERLHLYYLPKLREVIKVERIGSAATSTLVPSATFSFLKVIDIKLCSSMKTLLPHWLLTNLQNLEEIHVESCEQLREIIGAPTLEDEETGSDALIKFSLPKLRQLELSYLPELESICRKSGVMVCDSLMLMKVHRCSKLQRIPPFLPPVGNGQPYAYAPPSLQIMSSAEWRESLEWDDANFKYVLQPHFIDQ